MNLLLEDKDALNQVVNGVDKMEAYPEYAYTFVHMSLRLELQTVT